MLWKVTADFNFLKIEVLLCIIAFNIFVSHFKFLIHINNCNVRD